MSHLVSPIPDGGNRIQGIQVAGPRPILLLSAYMPCRGVKENIEDFEYCLAQLYELLQKYGNTHYIILSGDFNDDLYDQKSTRR